MRPILALALVGTAASDVVDAFGHALGAGIVSLAAWVLGGLTHAATATTSPQFDTWFSGPWRAMVAVAGLVAVPLFLAGVISSLLHGEGAAGQARVLARLGAAAVGTIVALGLVQLTLAVVDSACTIVENGSGVSLAAALARLGTALGITAAVGGSAAAAAGTVVLALVAALAGLVLWVELAVRSALIVVGTAFLPLGLAGLLWPTTGAWLRRLAEAVMAVAISKLAIVVVLVLGAAAISASPVSMGAAGTDLDTMVEGVAFLVLASFGLPMTLRFLPLAAEAAIHAGRGRAGLRWAASAPAQLDYRATTTASLLRRLNGGAGASPTGATKASDGTERTAS